MRLKITTLYTTSQNPHVARLVLSAFYQVAPEHKLRVIAPDVGGGFGSKIYIYPKKSSAFGHHENEAVSQMDFDTFRSLPHRCTWPGSHNPCGNGL